LNIFFHILLNNVIPIFVLIFMGYLAAKKFSLDINTLSKLNFYIFVPGFAFVNIYTTELPLEMLKILLATILILIANNFIGMFIAKLRGYDSGMTNAFKNTLMFYNSGNIGVPLITLVFSSGPYLPYRDTAVTAQIMVLVIQNITTNTWGFYNAGCANMDVKASVKKIIAFPTVYAIPLALILKTIPYDITVMPFWPALTYVRNGLVPIALITLGVQLCRTTFDFKNKEVYLSVVTRLLGGPIIALGLIYMLNFSGVLAQVLLISSAVPTAVNVALIAVECDNYQDFSSQTVMMSTLFSSVTLTIVIYAAKLMF
jgi:malate permease and related proteins